MCVIKEQDVREAGGGMRFGYGSARFCWGKDDGKISQLCSILKSEKVVCARREFSLRVVQWNNEAKEVNS